MTCSNSDIKCHNAKTTVVRGNSLFTLFGRSITELTDTSWRLLESGILKYFEGNWLYLLSYDSNREMEIVEYIQETNASPFKLMDLKILSIFITHYTRSTSAGFLSCISY